MKASLMQRNVVPRNGRLHLRVGEMVEVKSEAEILATLDHEGRLESLPFMPEMLKYCGRRFPVFKRAEKTCDTIQGTWRRRMFDTVASRPEMRWLGARRLPGSMSDLLEGAMAEAGVRPARGDGGRGGRCAR